MASSSPVNTDSTFPRRLLIAVGGNAIHPPGIRGTSEEQVGFAAVAGQKLASLFEIDNELIVTHGNGPGVGKVLLRQALARHRVATMSLDICVANSQGGIAYVLMQAFENALRQAGSSRKVACLLTRVEVDPDDPDFGEPSKPVGYFYSKEEAVDLSAELGWSMREDAGRGWRLVVPSPKPRRIVEIALIDAVAKTGAIVIVGGGGGIPVVRCADGARRGIEAVIDKDHTSALMANALGIETMMILTGVSQVSINFGSSRQKNLHRTSVSPMRKYLAEGQFPAGSMGPKVEAAIRFIEGGGRRAIIAHLDDALPALRGETGTHILADND